MPEITINMKSNENFEIFTDDELRKIDVLSTHLSNGADVHDAIMEAVDYMRGVYENGANARLPHHDLGVFFVNPEAQTIMDNAREMGVSARDYVSAAAETYQKMLLAVRADQVIEVVTPPQPGRSDPFEMVWP